MSRLGDGYVVEDEAIAMHYCIVDILPGGVEYYLANIVDIGGNSGNYQITVGEASGRYVDTDSFGAPAVTETNHRNVVLVAGGTVDKRFIRFIVIDPYVFDVALALVGILENQVNVAVLAVA